MTSNFLQFLILLLIALLFGKDTLLPAILKKFGFKNGNDKICDRLDKIEDISSRLHLLETNHLPHIQDDITLLKEDVAFIKGKLS